MITITKYEMAASDACSLWKVHLVVARSVLVDRPFALVCIPLSLGAISAGFVMFLKVIAEANPVGLASTIVSSLNIECCIGAKRQPGLCKGADALVVDRGGAQPKRVGE